jgi:GxxExxY protein
MVRDEKTYKIIGAAMEACPPPARHCYMAIAGGLQAQARRGRVHKELGHGFLEAVYQEALGRKFKGQEIPFKSQPTIQISYKGQPLNKTYQPDFVCYGEIILEIKAISSLSGPSQISYSK